jgi:hypothetical protein
LAVIGLACQSAEAGDQKSATREAKAILVTPAAAAPTNYEKQGAVTVGLFEGGYSVSPTRGSTREKEKPPREHKPITLLRFDSKFGDVKVQPVFGRVNGAQVSVGF